MINGFLINGIGTVDLPTTIPVAIGEKYYQKRHPARLCGKGHSADVIEINPSSLIVRCFNFYEIHILIWMLSSLRYHTFSAQKMSSTIRERIRTRHAKARDIPPHRQEKKDYLSDLVKPLCL